MIYSFDSSIAKEYGVDEAIFLNNLQFWILKNKANKTHFYDNHFWTYNSYDAFSSIFPFWNITQIKHIIKKLEDKKVIISGNYNKNIYDKTKWYAFIDEDFWLNGQNYPIDETNLSVREDKFIRPIPDIKPNIKPKEKLYKENPQSNSGFGLGTITQNEEQECDNTPIAKQIEDKSKNLFFGKTEDELIENTIYNWNIIANKHDFPRIQTITKPRLAKLKARIKQSGGIKEFWTILQDSIDDSKFLMYGNDTWKCNFDFVLQESSFVKIMEHQYK